MTKTRWMTQLRMGKDLLTLKSVEAGLMLPEEQVAIEQALQIPRNVGIFEAIDRIRMPLARMDARIQSDEQWAMGARDLALMALRADLSSKMSGVLFKAVVEWGQLPLDHHEHGYDALFSYFLAQDFDSSQQTCFGKTRDALIKLGVDINATPQGSVSPLAKMLLRAKEKSSNPLVWPPTEELLLDLVGEGARITHRDCAAFALEALQVVEKGAGNNLSLRRCHEVLAQALSEHDAQVLDERTDLATQSYGPGRRM